MHRRLRDEVEFIAGVDGITNYARGIIYLAWIDTQTARQRLTGHIQPLRISEWLHVVAMHWANLDE
eukprot:1368288-Pyramimonas_sp.AAC.1